MSIEEIEIEGSPTKKAVKPDAITGDFYQTFKVLAISRLLRLL